MIYKGEYYHILNRGNEKRSIYYESDNYLFFLKRLGKYLERYGPTLICYCLMPNHFHLLMCENEGEGIPRCLHSLQTSYAKAINKRFDRHGHLFQDSYKKIHIKTNNQLLHLSRYIHLNPVQAGLVNKPEEWHYSSYRDYIGIRRGQLPVMDIILSQFYDKDSYCEFVKDAMNDMDLEELTLE